jgi:plasmid stability protein
MHQLRVRGAPRDVVEALNRQAADHGRTVDAEHLAILEAALKPGRRDFWQRAARLRAQTAGRIVGDSADLIRELRDSD